MTVCHHLVLHPGPICPGSMNATTVSCHYLTLVEFLRSYHCFPVTLFSQPSMKSTSLSTSNIIQFPLMTEFYSWSLDFTVFIALLHGNNIFCVIHCHCGCCYGANIDHTPQEWRSSSNLVLNHPLLSLLCPSWDHDRCGSDKDLYLIL